MLAIVVRTGFEPVTLMFYQKRVFPMCKAIPPPDHLLQLTRRCNTILTNDLVDLRANLLSIIETEVK